MPTARRTEAPNVATGVISRQLDDQFVVVNPATNQAHSLAGAAADVWRDVVAGIAPLDTPEIDAALAEFAELGLLVTASGLSRRDVLKRGGLVLAGAGVATIALPHAAEAASPPATASISPTSGPRGATVTVTGSNFTPNSTITVEVGGVGATITSGGGTTATGTIAANTKFTVPAGPASGSNSVVITSGSGTAGAKTPPIAPTYNVVAAAVSFSPSSFVTKQSPTTITVNSSSGFLPGSTITVSGNGDFSNTTGSVTADANGRIPTGTQFQVRYGNGNNTQSGNIIFKDAFNNMISIAVTAT